MRSHAQRRRAGSGQAPWARRVGAGLVAAVMAATLAGCLTSKQTPAGCRARADAEYRRCLNPQWISEGEPVEPVRSDRSQACRVAHQQALDRCLEDPEVPTPQIRTSTTAAP